MVQLLIRNLTRILVRHWQKMNNTQDIEVHSITHEHILTILLSELHDRKDVAPGGCIQILDVGCGNGDLIRYIHQSLIQAFPSLEVAIHGLDVVDSGVQDQAYQVKTLQHLTAAVTDVQWGKRLHFISQNQQWPFPPNTFDFVLSNQVLEHVSNHETFFF